MALAQQARPPAHAYSKSEQIPLQPFDRDTRDYQFYDEEALRVSNKIDEDLKREGARKKEQSKRQVKVMLLGQAESGKSTLQKQFQLYYSSHTLDSERPYWRPVVYFNIIKAIRMVLDELDYELTHLPLDGTTEGQALEKALAPLGDVSGEISHLRTKLLALVAMEDPLARELSGGVSVSGGRTGVFVRAGWQALVTPLGGSRGRAQQHESEEGRAMRVAQVTELAARTLAEAQQEIGDLWKHPAVRILMDNRRIRLDESAPFFMESIERITQLGYLPSMDDILNVRLQTLGVAEHSFDIDMYGSRYNWLLYDVGGARGQRHAWVPYFDDATAIIFLAPISAFDQYLEEDARTNRVDDSLQLFTAICSNKLLKSAHLVLLLNKTDLLRKKIEAGFKVRKYITSYGDRPNTYADVSEYFRAHFIQAHKRNDISRRALYVHFTSMIDIKATQGIIVNVGEAIIRTHIEKTGLA
ncbi:G-protein alpha subunit [Coniophora puteana RWD-64-598 SS2]|uniref:G-protein alpha subunit n=1 Tax=Coniophora puteana (strain RWD-64-598) TaxID=741705 RepID=A0A5M3MWE9_CONPW|nr:G-protein alpha subunit [Coniophora puteana RWD-64-598 SS2]EIW83390.1 G-protein alpha subunit [Coniophora puteana RWD-64-598 SS2]